MPNAIALNREADNRVALNRRLILAHSRRPPSFEARREPSRLRAVPRKLKIFEPWSCSPAPRGLTAPSWRDLHQTGFEPFPTECRRGRGTIAMVSHFEFWSAASISAASCCHCLAVAWCPNFSACAANCWHLAIRSFLESFAHFADVNSKSNPLPTDALACRTRG